MAQPSAQEQYLLELINRFRTNPAAEYDLLVNSGDADVNSALGFFGTDLTLLANQWSSLTAAQPLAWSTQLGTSADTHNQLMIDADQQRHNFPGEPGLLNRINSAGSNSYSAVAENLYAYSDSPFYAHAGLAIDWGDDDNDPDNNFGTGIQNPAGHRNTLTNNAYREVGLSIIAEDDPDTEVGPLVVTQHFGDRTTGTNQWLLGVAFRDFDDDDFYSIGEGLDDVTINISGGGFTQSVQTGLAGGYQTLVPQGNYTVDFVRNGATLQTFNNVVVGNQSVKLDTFIEVGTAPSAGLGKITGLQFDDTNGNGIKDLGESGIANRSLFLDLNQNGQRDSSDRTAITDADGVYIFNNLTPGTYSIRPDIPTGQEQTFPISPLGNEFYQLDDGSAEGFIGLSASGGDALIFNQFETQGGPQTLTSISVGLSPEISRYPGLKNATKLFVYEDLDGDNQPDGDEIKREIAVALTGQEGFANVAIAPTTVNGTFFIGALYEGVDSEFTLVPRDTTTSAGKSWRATASNPNSFSASAASGYNWLLRANTDGLQGQVVQVKPDETIGGVKFSDHTTPNTINGTPNADRLVGTNDDDIISGLGAGDFIQGLAGNDTINGGVGNDIIVGGSGSDSLDGGANVDWVNYFDSPSSVIVTLNSSQPGQGGNAQGDTTSNFENLMGSNFNDTLFGDAGRNTLHGRSGDDSLSGGAGNDILIGSAGADSMDGGAGADYLNYIESGAGVTVTLNAGVGVGGDAQGDTSTGVENIVGSNFSDVLTGDEGNNLFYGGRGADSLNGAGGNDVMYGGLGPDSMDGGAGTDYLNYVQAAGGVTVTIGSGTGVGSEAQGDTNTGFEGIVGSKFNDVLTGDAGNNVIYGNPGADTLRGAGGNDVIYGGLGPDSMDGGAGTDYLNYSRSGAGVRVILNAGSGIGGESQGDTNTGFEGIVGSAFDDILTGDGSNNLLQGRNGDDFLIGGGGNDSLLGEAGSDTLVGGAGNDVLTGGNGADVFRFLSVSEGGDTINGFSGDTFEISASGFGGGLTVGVISSSQFVIGSSATTASHRFIYDVNRLYFDVDGSGATTQALVATINGSNEPIAASNIQVI